MNKGEVFEYKGEKYVLIDRNFHQGWNSGGMGETIYDCIQLDELLKLGDVEDLENINLISFSDSIGFSLSETKLIENEIPFAVAIRKPVLYTIRRKQEKTITVYE